MVGPSPFLPSTPLVGTNLRRLHLYQLTSMFARSDDGNPHLSDGALSSVLHLFVSGCPRLEALSVSHGHKYLSRGEIMPPLPRLGDAFVNAAPPRSLVMLHLQDIVVTPEDFSSCELPELRFCRLINAGEDAKIAKDALVAACPKLTGEACVVRDEPLDDATIKEAVDGARLRAKHHYFPTRDLSGLSLDGVLDVLQLGYYHR